MNHELSGHGGMIVWRLCGAESPFFAHKQSQKTAETEYMLACKTADDGLCAESRVRDRNTLQAFVYNEYLRHWFQKKLFLKGRNK